MGAKSSIEWTDATWTPIRARVRIDAADIAREKGYTSLVQIAERMAGRVGPHCEKIAPGCANCYSETNNSRCLPHNGTGLPFDRRARDLVDVFLDEKILRQPLKWREPRSIFVCSQTDLFGEWVPDSAIARMFAVMAASNQHRFIVLTKRAERMACWMPQSVADAADRLEEDAEQLLGEYAALAEWPLPNVILGASASDQSTLDAAVPHLLRAPAACRVLSIEPLLGPVNLQAYLPRRMSLDEIPASALNDGFTEMWTEGIGWVIVGGESGPGARLCNVQWIRDIVRQCKDAEVPVFVKQLGAKPQRLLPISTALALQSFGGRNPDTPETMRLSDRKGGDMDEWPEDLRVRELPEVLR